MAGGVISARRPGIQRRDDLAIKLGETQRDRAEAEPNLLIDRRKSLRPRIEVRPKI
jgi:hypothetical protein